MRETSEPRKDWKEHLDTSTEPIRLCIMNNSDTHSEEQKEIRERGQRIGYFDHPGGRGSTYKKDFFISKVDERDKFSDGYRNCGGIVVAGYDPKLKKHISFITHQRTDVMLADSKQRKEFETDLREKLRELKGRSAPGTIDAATFAGSFSSDFSRDREHQNLFNLFMTFAGDYKRMGKIIRKILHEELGFYADAVQGPNLMRETSRIDFGTQTRHLFSQRPEQSEGSGADTPFNLKDLEKVTKKLPKRFLLDEKGRLLPIKKREKLNAQENEPRKIRRNSVRTSPKSTLK